MQPFSTTFEVTKDQHLGYLLHVPDKGPERLPLILFLHGHGESGSDLAVVETQGLPKYIGAHPEFPFITVAPQCPWGTWWPELAASLNLLLDEIIASYPVDTSRIYLTGLSMGGYGSWYMGSTRPERFAAVAPICGGGYWFHRFPERVRALRDTPVWAFHGAKDEVVPLWESEVLVNELEVSGGDVRLTIYPEADHDSWTETYNNPELYEWFLKHSLK